MKNKIIFILTFVFLLALSTTVFAFIGNTKPVALINSNPESEVISTNSGVYLDHLNSYDPDGDQLINVRYAVYMQVQDKKGEWSDWTKKDFYSDNVSVTLTSPQQGTTLTTAPITFTADVVAYDVVSKVEFYVDGEKIGEDISAPYSYTWNVPPGNSGARNAYAKVILDNGKNFNSASNSFTIDITYQSTLTVVKDGTDQTFEGGAGYDTFVGDALKIHLQNYSPDVIDDAILQWDLSSIPNDATIVDAKIITSNSNLSVSSTFRIGASWSESQTRSIFDTYAGYYGGFPYINRNLVQGWVDGSIVNYGVGLSTNSTVSQSFDAREMGNGAKLIVRYK